jgi:hypothetical protein
MDIDEFAQALKRAGWLEGDQVGFHMDVDAALSTEVALFKWRFQPADTVEAMVFEIEWVGEGSTTSDINRDFYRLCGRFAEDVQFTSRVLESDHIRYNVVVGSRSHGHVATFKVTGDRAAAIVRGLAGSHSKKS